MKNFTTIQDNTKEKNTKLIKAISYSKNLTEFLFKEYGLDRKEGILKNIYSIFFKYGIKIKVSNVCIDDISIFTEKTNEKTNKNILGKIKKIYPKLTININEKKLSVLIVVSDYIKKSSKLIGRIILELTKNNIEVLNLNLSSNEFTLIIGIKHSQIKKAIKVLYDKFISY